MTKYALIIAIPEYGYAYKDKPLPKTTQDAEAIAKILHQYGDYDITRLPRKGNADTAEYEMKAGKVTDEELYNELELFLTKKAENQPALIYFTGHGFTICDRLGREKGFLATSNCKVTDQDQPIIKQENALPLEDLNYLIEKANLSELVLLLDCCHSGNFIETHLMQKSLKTFEYRQNYYLITACRSFETAKSIRKEEHSVFSGAIIEGLSDKRKDEKGKISCDRLFDFVNRKMGGKLQTPMRMGIGESITLVKYPLSNNQEISEIEPIRDNNSKIVCPYQGLNVFTAKEKAFFFGRQRLTEDIKQKLEEFGVIPIIGASGSGKSSVVYAGVMAWLEAKSQEWCILPTIKPGSKPLSQLIQVFKEQVTLEESELDEIIEDEEKKISDIIQFLPNSRKYFLFIDQFEEVFTVCSEEKERKRFIDLITQIKVKNPYNFAIITTMRADFLDRCLQYQSLHQIIQHRAIYIPPLQEKDKQDIIVKPAQHQGYQIENDLLLRLLSDVGKKQGFLPLLEFALTLLWEKRDKTTKTLTKKSGVQAPSFRTHSQEICVRMILMG
ncbi:MAG: caspase family protein [Crocosphaera sp.]|nr:caspase family protein [Crocosphaera sp.]